MRILLATGIYPPDAGGPATYTRALARALSSQGHEVQVVCYGDKDEIMTHDGYPVERIRRRHSLPIRYWKFFQAIRRRASHCDLVYLQGPVSEGLPGTLGAMFARKPTVMKIVGDYAWEIYAGNGGIELLDEFIAHRHAGKIRLLEMIERWTAKHARNIIVPSEYLKGVVMKWGGDASRITVIYNAVDRIPPGGGDARTIARRKLGLPISAPILLTVARAVPWKSCDFLIDLMTDLPDVHFVIAGDGPSRSSWEMLTHEKKLTDRVHFMGKVEHADLGDVYTASDLFVLPSGYEGFANVIPEAISNGLHCFVSDKGGNPETQNVFGKDSITILPYRDRERWLQALQAPWPARSTPLVLSAFIQPRVMVERTLAILQSP